MENEVIIDLTKGPGLLTQIFHEYAKLSEQDTFAGICLYDFLTMSYKSGKERRVYQSLKAIRTIAYSGMKFNSSQESPSGIIDEW